MQHFHASVVIVGAGVAGLWLLNRLRQQNINAIVLEKTAIGHGQTRCAQGIIHGGAKYALTGKVSAAANSVAQMTSIWAECLSGKGEIDLSTVRTLSDAHYLWSMSRLTGGIKSFISAKILHSDSEVLKFSDYPKALQDPRFKGSVCRLQESVLDIPSLTHALATPHLSAIWHADDRSEYHYSSTGELREIIVRSADQAIRVTADQYVLTAGIGNASILSPLRNAPAMQRRPLQMVWMTFPKPRPEYALYLHCVNAGTVPRLTITTHQKAAGNTVWYLGGGLSEQGINRSPAEQIHSAQQEITTLLPWIDITDTEWGTGMIDRAEQENGGRRPDHPGVYRYHNLWVCWPTKLTLAPALSAMLLKQMSLKSNMDGVTVPKWITPPFAKPWWE